MSENMSIGIPATINTNHHGKAVFEQPDEDLSLWPDVLVKRSNSIEAINNEIADKFKTEYGENSPQALSTEIFASLTKPIGDIARFQYKLLDIRGSYSWEDVAPIATQGLKEKIDKIKNDEKYNEFFQVNPSFKSGLEFLQDVSGIRDASELQERSIAYEELCKDAIANDQIVLFTSYTSEYYVDTPMFEICASLVFPPTNEEKELIEKFDNFALSNLTALNGNEKFKNSKNIIGTTITSAGFEVISQTSGMALDGPEGGFFLSLNSYKDKRRSVWQKALTEIGEDKDTDYIPTLLAFYIHHEEGHNFFNGDLDMNEILTDIPAIAYLIKSKDVDPKKLICFILGESIPEVNADYGENDTFNSYKLSAIFILNKFFEKRIIIFNDNSDKFQFNTEQPVLEEFSKDILDVHKKLIANDEETLSSIRKITPSTDVSRLVKILV